MDTMTNWLLFIVAVLYFCASMSSFYDGKVVWGCVLLSWASGNLGLLLLSVGAR